MAPKLGIFLVALALASSHAPTMAAPRYIGPYVTGPCPNQCNARRIVSCSICDGGVQDCIVVNVCATNHAVACSQGYGVSFSCRSWPTRR